MTGLLLLAMASALWFAYAVVGAFVALGGPRPLPRFVRPLLEQTPTVAETRAGRVGAVAVAAVWLVLAFGPQLALLREALSGRTEPSETLAIALGTMVCVGWSGFLSLRYLRHRDTSRPGTRPPA
jgi:hypothetical protein